MNRVLTLAILAISILSCTDSNRGLDSNVQTIELTYIAWACDCANWATKSDLEKYSGDTLARQSIFVEPANKDLELPDFLGYNNDVIKFTGQFYKNKGFPKGYHSYEDPEKSRVFRYSKYEVVKSNFKKYQNLNSQNE